MEPLILQVKFSNTDEVFFLCFSFPFLLKIKPNVLELYITRQYLNPPYIH